MPFMGAKSRGEDKGWLLQMCRYKFIKEDNSLQKVDNILNRVDYFE